MATSSKHTEWILETIDHLRRRKARPDLQRICHVVRRRYGLCAADTEVKLEKLVDAEIVIKVDYKGSISYRNAAKWRKSMLGCAVLNSTTISTKILEAILELSRKDVKENDTKQTQDGENKDKISENENNVRVFASEIGVTLDSINVWLRDNCDGFDSLRSPLTVVLKREIDAGRIKRLMSCNYVITTAQMQEISDKTIKPLKSNKKSENKSQESPIGGHNGSNGMSASEESSNNSIVNDHKFSSQTDQPTTSFSDHRTTLTSTPATATSTASGAAQPARRGRPPKHRPPVSTSQTAGSTSTTSAPSATGSSAHSKLKRIRSSDSHGQPSDGAEQKMPKKMETRKGSTVSEPVCDFCKLTSQCSPKGVAEELLHCKDCAAKAHPSCMRYSSLLATRAYRGPWQCMDCKTCCVCQDAGDPDQMLFCDGCDKGYHMNCHNPSIIKKPSGIWECSQCRLENLSLQRTEFMSRQGSHHTVTHESAPPTPAESPVPSNLVSNSDLQLPTKPYYLGDGKYPDAAGWSVIDVVDYLTSAGFQDEAKVFLEQEIDGVALLLLKRTDVLKGLNLKLGPALKLNRHIQCLQSARQLETT